MGVQQNQAEDKKSGSTSAQSPGVGPPYFGFGVQAPTPAGLPQLPQYQQYLAPPFMSYPYGGPADMGSNQHSSVQESERSSNRPQKNGSEDFSGRISPLVHHQTAKNLDAVALHGLDKPNDVSQKKHESSGESTEGQKMNQEKWKKHKADPEPVPTIKVKHAKEEEHFNQRKWGNIDVQPKNSENKFQEKKHQSPKKLELEVPIPPPKPQEKFQPTDSSKILKLLKEVKEPGVEKTLQKDDTVANKQLPKANKAKKVDKKQRKQSRSRSKSKQRAQEEAKISNSSRKRIELLNKRFDMFFQKKKEEPEEEEPDYNNQDLSPRTPEDQEDDFEG